MEAPQKSGFLLLGAVALMGCAPQPVDVQRGAAEPVYRGIETRLIDTDLVNFRVYMQNAASNAEVAAYAQCAAAQYALIRGYGFARHVSTNVEETGGVWLGDAVYTISADLPEGRSTIDAEVTVANCDETGIPTV